MDFKEYPHIEIHRKRQQGLDIFTIASSSARNEMKHESESLGFDQLSNEITLRILIHHFVAIFRFGWNTTVICEARIHLRLGYITS